MKVQLRMSNSVVIPSILYGGEMWTPGQSHEWIGGFCDAGMKTILRISISVCGKKRNTEIRAVVHMETVEMVLQKRRLRWLGHVPWMRVEYDCKSADRPKGSMNKVTRSCNGQMVWCQIYRRVVCFLIGVVKHGTVMYGLNDHTGNGRTEKQAEDDK